MRVPLTLGLHLPNFNFPDTPPERLLDKLTGIARAAEGSGFSSITLMDHYHQIPGVGLRTNWMLEGNTALGALAARTERVSLGLLVGGVMYRNPAFHAKAVTTLDVLSGGRAVLGLGAAWFEEEHLAYGFPFPRLGERFEHLEEALQIARLMFTEDEPSFEGEHHRIADALNNPKPVRGDIPILIGGSGEKKTLRLVAKYADGSNVFGDVERCKHLMEVLDGHCADVGRDPKEITRTRMATTFIAPTHEAAQAKFDRALQAGSMDPERMRAMSLVGGPEEIVEQAVAFREVGIEGLTLMVPDAHDEEVVALAGEVLGPVFG